MQFSVRGTPTDVSRARTATSTEGISVGTMEVSSAAQGTDAFEMDPGHALVAAIQGVFGNQCLPRLERAVARLKNDIWTPAYFGVNPLKDQSAKLAQALGAVREDLLNASRDFPGQDAVGQRLKKELHFALEHLKGRRLTGGEKGLGFDPSRCGFALVTLEDAVQYLKGETVLARMTRNMEGAVERGSCLSNDSHYLLQYAQKRVPLKVRSSRKVVFSGGKRPAGKGFQTQAGFNGGAMAARLRSVTEDLKTLGSGLSDEVNRLDRIRSLSVEVGRRAARSQVAKAPLTELLAELDTLTALHERLKTLTPT